MLLEQIFYNYGLLVARRQQNITQNTKIHIISQENKTQTNVHTIEIVKTL